MSVYTINGDNSFFDEKTIVCPQKLNRIYQLRLMTLYNAPAFSFFLDNQATIEAHTMKDTKPMDITV